MADSRTKAELKHAATVDKQGRPGDGLINCDREAIHLPGSIQPHGMLLVADCTTLAIVGAAGAVAAVLTPDWLGGGLSDVLRQDLTEQAADLVAGRASVVVLAVVRGKGGVFNATMRLASGRLAVELEPLAQPATPGSQMLAALDDFGEAFDAAPDLKTLCLRAATAFRSLTGFDRVMIYRFFDDEAGSVIAEDQVNEIGSFLNHHFPATDIPQQARALYVRNRVRVIPDIHYQPAPLTPGDWGDFDMSDVALRSVSPNHLQYMKNMGVAASASISIVRDNKLWGLVACHHRTPRQLSHETRVTCTALAGVLARQIRAKDDAELLRQRVRLRAQEDAILAHLGGIATLASFITDCGDDLCRMFGADGFAAVQGSELYRSGKCVGEADALAVAAWVRAQAQLQPFCTDRLSEIYPDAAPFRALASGLMAITLTAETPIVLMWFRAEQLEVVNWAGNPHKATSSDPLAQWTPRASFEAWSETVRGRSLPWTPPEIDAANRLSRTMLAIWQTRRLRVLNNELIATIADNQELLVEKDFLIKEVHHRVQNSLALVSSFLGIQSQATASPELTAQLGEARRRLSAVALVHRRLYSGIQLQSVDLARYLEDLCTDTLSSMGEAWGGLISFDLAAVVVPTDRAVNVGLILTELLINAQKYAYAGAPGPIAVTLARRDADFVLIIADRGAGVSQPHTGFGTRMLTAMIKRLAGTIVNSADSPGLRVTITAPINEPVAKSR